MMRRLWCALALMCAPVMACAQSSPGFTGASSGNHNPLTAAALNGAFESKADVNNGTLNSPTISSPILSGIGSGTVSGTNGLSINFSAGTVAGRVSTTAATGYEQNGTTLITSGTQANNPVLFAGAGAGHASDLATDEYMTGFGAWALYNAHGQLEDTADGIYACNQITTGNFSTCLGTHALGFEQTTSANTAVGEDDQRNTVGASNMVGLGANANRNGAPGWGVSTGAGAAYGNASSITITGTPTTGDVITLSMSTSNPNVSGLPASPSYTVKAGDTLTDIAAGLVSAIDAANINGQGVVLTAFQSAITGGPATIGLDFPGASTTGWAITTTASVSGAATETVTVSGGYTGYNNDVSGYEAMFGAGLTTANNLEVNGAKALPWATTDSGGVANGSLAMGNALPGNSNFDVGGYAAGYNLDGTWGNVLHGSQAGKGLKTGDGNVISGYEDTTTAQNCVTTGSFNWEVGYDACVASPTANGQMAVQNAIYGTNNTGTGYTLSTGQVTIEEQLPAAAFTEVALGGEVVVGSGTSPLATNATSNFFHLPYTSAAPTGTPANVLGNACEINTATESLNCYIGSSWYHVALTAGTN